MGWFSPAERDAVREQVLAWARADDRVVAGAIVGSLADGEGDRWSDVDLTFGVRDGVEPLDVLDGWATRMRAELGAVALFDVAVGETTYRVFLLPSCLQVDLSASPAAGFSPRGPRFRLLFGEAGVRRAVPAGDAGELFGHAVHHALRARVSIERGRRWQAAYWIGEVRDCAMRLACRGHGLPEAHGRGFDALPDEVLEACAAALVRELEEAELRRALACAIDVLLGEAGRAPELAAAVVEQLRWVASGGSSGAGSPAKSPRSRRARR